MKTQDLAISQIVINNPIIKDCEKTKEEYLRRLKKYLSIGGWSRRKYEAAELAAYQKIIMENIDIDEKNFHEIEFYKYYILFDLIHILAYEIDRIPKEKIKKVKKQYLLDFPLEKEEKIILNKIFSSGYKNGKRIRNLEKDSRLQQEKKYLDLIKKNLEFINKNPFKIMVTATMSAGKSTFINSLTGKNICLAQNMACTSKIHYIMNKPYEDGYSYEYDHDLVMTAGKEELLNDNELNTTDKIVVSTHFGEELGKQRIVINDSPGVNYSGDKDHKKITDHMLESRDYQLLIYVMNATQLATNDEDEHLEFIKNTIGRTPVIFVINKIDALNEEEENILEIIEKQVEYLKKKGFKKPVVCPISSKAGYLAKQFDVRSFSESEIFELYNYIGKFERMKLSKYYKKYFCDIEVKDEQEATKNLLKTCGIKYIQEIINAYCE